MTDETTDIQWFIARDGKQHGPLSDIEMRTFIAHSYLRASDLIWRPGMPEWVVATLVFPQVFQPGQDPIAPAPQHSVQPSPPRSEPKVATSTPVAAAAAAASRAAATASDRGNERTAAGSGYAGSSSSGAFPNMGATNTVTPDRADFAYDTFDTSASQPPRSKRRLVFAGVALAALCGGAYALTTYPEPISAIVSELSGGEAAESDTAVISAPDSDGTDGTQVRAAMSDSSSTVTAPAPEPARRPAPSMQAPGIAVTLPPEPGSGGLTEFQTAALPPEPAKQEPPSIAGSAIDAKLQKIPAWALIKSEFPDWYVTHIADAERLRSQSRPESEIAEHLAQGLVSLRRQNAKKALAAGPEKLERVAVAFLDNLRALRAQSVSACYGFISKGEASPAVVQLMEDPEAATTFHAQITAIFEAIAEGNTAPHEHKAAVKADYDMLIRELGKLGWKEEDLQVFSNPRLLSQREPDQVCKMVQDWFVAHLAVADQPARNRLLYETLKPVVSG